MYRFLADLCEPFLLLYLLAALAVANLWRKRLESRRRLLLVTVAFVALAALSTRAVAYLAVGSLEWQYPPRHDRPDRVEAIVVLACAVLPPDEVRLEAELGADTLARCIHAARLYHQGEPCPVVVSGGRLDPGVEGLTAAAVMRDFLLEQGLAQSDLLMEDESRTTYENAERTAVLLRQRAIQRIALVTDAVDLLRAERCFRAQGFEVTPSGSRYRATHFNWSLFDFLPSAGAARDTQRALQEWLGMAWYWLHGRI